MPRPPAGTGATPAEPPVLPLVDALPRLAALALVALGLVGTPLLLLDAFTPLPVLLGTGLLLAALETAWRLTAPRAGRVPRRTAVAGLLALLVAALSAAANARWGSQHLLVDGDPAVYAVAGQLLAETGSLRIETLAQEVYGGVASLNYAGAGFDAYDGGTEVRPSFMHLLPQLLAVASWLGGAQALLWANAVVGGLALLAVFAFGSRLTGRPEWALTATVALALLRPQQHFSRDTFSEIPAQLLVFAGLVLVFDAVRRSHSSWVPGLLGGLVLGVSCLARIDAFFYLVPLVMALTVLVLAGAPRLAGAIGAGVVPGAVLGYVDLRVGSPAYLGLQSGNLDMIFVALAATAVGCAVLVVLRERARALWDRLHGRVLAGTVVGAVVLLSAYAGLVRPHVEVGRHADPLQPTAVAALQEAAGLAVDPLRTYDERSLHWLSWYLGPLAVTLGLLGFAVLLWRLLRRRRPDDDPRLLLAGLLFVLLFGASTALYVWRPSIVPVQIWATRRFLPVTIPGLLLCAAWLGALLTSPGGDRRRLRAAAAGGVGLALVVPPLVYLQGHSTDRSYVPMLAVTEQLCDVLEPTDAVLLHGAHRLTTTMPQTLHAFCGVPTAVVSNITTVADVQAAADAAQAAGRRLVVLTSFDVPEVVDGPLPGEYEFLLDVPVTVVALSLTGRPDDEYRFGFRVVRGTLD